MAFIPLATASTIGNLQRTVDPTASDDEFGVGTQWINTTNNKVYTLVDNSTGAAVWIDVTDAGSAGMQIGAGVVVNLSQNQTYTVPGNNYFQGSVFGVGTGTNRYNVQSTSQSGDLIAPNEQTGQGSSLINVPSGVFIRCTSGSVRIVGWTLVNG